jgi:hypothetical protein
MTDLHTDAVRVAAELRAAAPFLATPEARTTLREAAVLLDTLREAAVSAAELETELTRVNADHAELADAVALGEKWLPTGLWWVEQTPGRLSRQWVQKADEDTLEQLLPRAALLRHDEAITRAVMGMMADLIASVPRGADGVPLSMPWPAAYHWAQRIREEIEKELTPPPSERAQELSARLAEVGFGVTPEQAQVALDWRTNE